MPSNTLIEKKALVVLSESDEAYRQSCIDQEKEFSEPFLKETRAQRLGCSVRDLDCMFNYERNLHLADEALVMRLSTWATDPVTYIDWERINLNAKHKAEILAHEFSEFRKQRMETQIEGRTKRSTRKGMISRE